MHDYRIFGTKGPWLVFENGLGNSIFPWENVVEGLKDHFRILVYHRLGYGKSSGYQSMRSVDNICLELNHLLEKLKVEESFILVGHSFGGLIAQYYAKTYKERLIGLVLIDSTSVAYEKMIHCETPTMNSMVGNQALMDQWQAAIDLDDDSFQKTYDDEKLAVMSSWGTNKGFMSKDLFRTVTDEMANFKASSQLVKVLANPAIKTYVLSRDPQISKDNYITYGMPEKEVIIHESIWSDLQRALALEWQTEPIICPGSDHMIMSDQPMAIINVLKTYL